MRSGHTQNEPSGFGRRPSGQVPVAARVCPDRAYVVPAALCPGLPPGRNGVVFLRFNLIGAIGAGVQLALLVLLTRTLHLSYLRATGIAVALTVLHNFAWHERFTFAHRLHDSASRSLGAVGRRFLKFNLLTGVVSVAGNVLLMQWLRGYARLPLLVANLFAIAICGGLNYLANDRLVFIGTQNEKLKLQN